MRSQATSIVLAKAVNKSKSSPPMSLLLLALVLKTYGDVYRTIKRSSFWITAHTWLRGFFTPPWTQDLERRCLPSVAFTPGGPLVYQWQMDLSTAPDR
jgi:hypothetical protein